MMKYKATKFQQVADLVINYTGTDIFNSTKKQDYVDCRGLFDTIMRNEYGFTLDAIARFYQRKGFSKRSHCTILYSVKNFNNEIKYRRTDLNTYLVEILQTEVTLRQYEAIFNLIMRVKTQKGLQQLKYLAHKIINNVDVNSSNFIGTYPEQENVPENQLDLVRAIEKQELIANSVDSDMLANF